MSKNICMYCDGELGYEPQMCCDGQMCGCMGMPTEPPVCSPYCYYMAFPHQQANITQDQLEKYKEGYVNGKEI